MTKKLTEMTNEELWQLFPIILTEHNPLWKDWYGEEKKFLTPLLPACAVLHHIGSTAIEGIWAKPTIDILAVLPEGADIKSVRDTLTSNGYICMAESERRISLNKGYTPSGFAERVFHLHLRFSRDTEEIIFRDYLAANSAIAKEYEKLKLDLWKKFEHDRDAYTIAKTDFIKNCLAKAKDTKIAKEQ